MRELLSYKTDGFVHFIGCGGAGTRPLMRIFHELGFTVSGSDLAESPSLERLRGLGLRVFAGHDKAHLPTADGKKLLLVYSSAVTEENPELAEARRIGGTCIRRGEALGLLAGLFPHVIAVSGSHGKTSVSAMITHILKTAGLKPGYLIGADVVSWEESGSAGAGKIFVCEADESDGTHTAIHASTAVVTNIEDDHAWNFASPEILLENFRKFGFQAGKLIYTDAPPAHALFQGHPCAYPVSPGTVPEDPRFASFGHYRKINAALALEAVTRDGLLDRESALEALLSFPGVARRLQIHCEGEKQLLIEDYAHHPTELAASIRTLRELHPGRRPGEVTIPGGELFQKSEPAHTAVFAHEEDVRRHHGGIQEVERDHPVRVAALVDDSRQIADQDQPEKDHTFADRILDRDGLPDRCRPACAETDHHNCFK